MLVVLILYIVPATMLVRVALNNASTENNVLRGARAVAIWLEQSGHKHFYYACQEYDPSDSLAPNLAWYTRGWTCGWRLGYTMTYVPSPLEWIGNGPVVYLTSADSERTALFTQSMHGRELVLRTDSYLIYE